jgi:hypothetical protein
LGHGVSLGSLRSNMNGAATETLTNPSKEQEQKLREAFAAA